MAATTSGPTTSACWRPGPSRGRGVLGHRQVTDNYLLALAVRHQGRFVTFDSRVQLDAVTGAEPQHLLVLAG